MQYEQRQLQPTQICTHAWNSRARLPGRWPVKPSNSKKPCAVSESLVRNSASLCTWPGPNATSTNGKRANTSSLTDCAQQPPTPTTTSGRSRLTPLRLAEVRDEPVVGLLADRAGVEEDQVGVGARRRLGVAERLEHALHALGVVLVHLAAERRDVVALHRPRSVAGARTSFSASRSAATNGSGCVVIATCVPGTSRGATSRSAASSRCLRGGTSVSPAGTMTARGWRRAAEPRAAVVPAELAAGLGDVASAAARELGGGPRRARLVGKPERAEAGPPRGVREQAELEAHEAHEAPAALHPRLLPVGRRRAEDDALDEIRVVAGEQARDRPAHRVADGEHAVDPLVAEDRGGVVGAVDEAERRRAAQPAAVAAVVEREDAVPGAAQRVVDRDPVEVGRHHPAVQEQQRRAVAAGVAQEELAAARDVDDAPGQRLDRRLGDEARRAPTAQERRERARATGRGTRRRPARRRRRGGHAVRGRAGCARVRSRRGGWARARAASGRPRRRHFA